MSPSPAVPKHPLADPQANLEDLHLLRHEVELLQSKFDLIHQADAALQMQEEALRKQRQSWMSAVGELMQLSNKRVEEPVDSLDAAGNTCEVLEHSSLQVEHGDIYVSGRQVSPRAHTTVGFSSPRFEHVLRAGTRGTGTSPRAETRTLSVTDRVNSSRRIAAETVCKKEIDDSLAFAKMPSLSLQSQTFCRKILSGLQKFVRSNTFEASIFAMIFINVVFVGVEVDFMAASPGIVTPMYFVVVNFCFTFCFSLELLLRLITSGGNFFCPRDNKDWSWNWFDIFVVLSSVVENLASSLASSAGGVDLVHFRVIRVIRVTRLLRTFRMVRMVRFVRALRTLVHSIMVTLRAAIWSLFLMTIILYGFGVAFTQAVMDYCDAQSDDINGSSGLELRAAGCSNAALPLFFGTLPRSMFTLFKSITGGISWHEVVGPLSTVGWLWVMTFIFFLIFTLFAVLNVITGLFCQSAVESAQQDKDIATMQMMANKGHFMQCLKEIFKDIDADDDGCINIQEFEDALHDRKCQAFLESLDIPVHDAWALFKLLDADESGSIDSDEFFMGCLHLRGHASAVDIAKMHHDNKVFFDFLEDFMGTLEEHMLQMLQVMPQALAGRDAAHELMIDLQASWGNEATANGRARRRRRAATVPPGSDSPGGSPSGAPMNSI